MNLELLLKPIIWLDQNVLKQYTKLGQKININEGKKKYQIGLSLWAAYAGLTVPTTLKLFNDAFCISSNLLFSCIDGFYNVLGMAGNFKDEEHSESTAVNSGKHFFSEYNTCVRIPTFVFGVGLIGKFGIDLINNIKNKTPFSYESYSALLSGIGHLSLASSIYLKETNPKLLEKENVPSLVPVPSTKST
jgi:hypothetical protein